MGGQLIKGYTIQGETIAAAGLIKSWKILKGHKSGAHAAASIFLIEKKQLKKQEKDEVIKFAKKEASSLLRVRHPGVLAVIQPLTEDQNILAFVTERIEGNISQLIKQNKLQEFVTSELELKLYLYPFIQTIAFIHDSLKQAHLAISLDNIYLNSQGKWKLAGFGLNQNITGEDLLAFEQKISDYSCSAPELALQKQYCKKSDVFSIGLVIVNLLQYINKSGKSGNSITDRNEYQKQMSCTKNVGNLPAVVKSKNPAQLQQFLKNILIWDYHQRSTLSQILQSGWMNDGALITVKYLDKISNYENKQQLQFLKGLAGVLDDFQIRVIIKIILPKLLDLLKFNHLIASIIYIIVDLLKKNKVSADIFKKQVWPSLKNVTQAKEITAQAIYLIVINLQILEKYVGEPDTSTHLMPLYIKCFQCPQKLKHLALTMLQKIAKKIDYQFLKARIIPKVIGLLKDPNIDVRKDALIGLYSILNLIDSQTLSFGILPNLQAARKLGSDPLINALITRMYNIMTETLSGQIIGTKILPVLIPYLTEPSINRYQFSQFKLTIVRMIDKIEREREKTFENGPITNENVLFNQSDFKFKEEEQKLPEQKKGNYNFLANYVQSNTQQTVVPQTNPATVINNNISFPQNSTGVNSLPSFQFNINQGVSFNNDISKVNQQQQPIPTIPSFGNNSSPPQNFGLSINSNDINALSFSQPIQSTSNDSDFLGSYVPPVFQTKKVETIPKIQPIKPIVQNNTNFNFSNDIYSDMTFSMGEQSKTNKTSDFNFVQSKTTPMQMDFNFVSPIDKPIKKQSDKPKSNSDIKIMGGASGPIEVRRFVGPPSLSTKEKTSGKQSQSSKVNNLDMNYFDNKYSPPAMETNLFSNQFEIPTKQPSFNDRKPEISPSTKPISKPIAKPGEPLKRIQKPKVNENLFTDAIIEKNPFEQLEKKEDMLAKFRPIVVTTPIQKGQGNDIYSYFESAEEEGEPQPSNTAKTSFDLI